MDGARDHGISPIPSIQHSKQSSDQYITGDMGTGTQIIAYCSPLHAME